MTNLERERIAALWAMTPADHLDMAIQIKAVPQPGAAAEVQTHLLFALVKKTLGEPRFENEGTGS
jgi:hypothetical protein